MNEFETTLKGIGESVEKVGEAVTETQKGLDAMKHDVQESEKAAHESIKGMQKQLDELMEAQKSTFKGENKERAALEGKYTKIWLDFLATGEQKRRASLNELFGEYKDALASAHEANGEYAKAAEIKELSTDKLQEGGAIVPVGIATKIVEKQRDFSPIRQYATVERTSTTSLVIPGEGDDFAFEWVGEREARSDTDTGTFTDVDIPVHEASAIVPVTRKMLVNAAFDMENFIVRKAADRIARGEANAFVIGDGVKKPRGFMTYTSGTTDGAVQQVTGSTSTALVHEDLTLLKAPVRGAYRANGRYFFNRFTEALLENLEDGNGRPLFNDGNVANGITPTLKNYPFALLDDMDGADESTLALTAGDLVMLYGDMARFYNIVDHASAMVMVRDIYTTPGKIKLRFEKMVGGGVVDFRAATILKVKA
jgi:HK97 family phage major capsid protein